MKKGSRNSPFIVKVSLPHRLLKFRHDSFIKWRQSGRTLNKIITKSQTQPASFTCLPAEETVGVEGRASSWEDVQESMNGSGWVAKVQNKICKFLQQYRKCESSGRSTVTLCCWSVMHRSFQPLINQKIECLCKTVQLLLSISLILHWFKCTWVLSDLLTHG